MIYALSKDRDYASIPLTGSSNKASIMTYTCIRVQENVNMVIYPTVSHTICPVSNLLDMFFPIYIDSNLTIHTTLSILYLSVFIILPFFKIYLPLSFWLLSTYVILGFIYGKEKMNQDFFFFIGKDKC